MVGAANDLNISENGFQTFNNTNGVFHGRTLTAGTGITITNGSGLLGDPVIASTAAATDLHTARFIVASSTAGTGANFTTIAAAIASAQGTGINSTIFLQPGTYTENLTLPAGINLTAFQCDQRTPNVTIIGNITCSDAGSRTIAGIRLQTNSAAFLTVSANAAIEVNLVGCFFNCSNATGISYSSASSSSFIRANYCFGDIATTGISLFTMTSAGRFTMFHSRITNSGASSTASTVSAGTLDIAYNEFDFPITSSGTSTVGSSFNDLNSSAVNTGFIWGNNVGSNNDAYSTGSASAISITTSASIINASISSTNANPITGAGSLTYGGINFATASSTINTTTQIPSVSSNDAVKVVTPGAYPYTTIPQDQLIKVDTSSARTIVPLASPTTGQRHIIKDTVGTAAANNITITPSGKNIDGAASYLITTNYGCIEIVYNGTEWSIC